MPFQAENIAALSYQVLNAPPAAALEFRRDVPGEIDVIVKRAIERDISIRYQTWQQFSDDLAAVASGSPCPGTACSRPRNSTRCATSCFSALFSDAELWEVLRFSEWLTAEPGQPLVREGDPGGFFCILVSGEAKVAAQEAPDHGAQGRRSASARWPHLAGENKPRIADVIAASNVRLIKIPIAALERASEMCKLNFDRSFLRVLVERLTLANSRLTGT